MASKYNDSAVRARVSRLLSVRRSLPLFLAVVVCLCGWQVWLTYRVMEQDRMLAVQRSRERLDQTADLAISQLTGHLADWDLLLREADKLPLASNKMARLPAGVTLLSITPTRVQTQPEGAVLFVPSVPAAESLPAAFERISDLEFRSRDFVQALQLLQPLIAEAGTRGEALLRMARLQRKLNHTEQGKETYRRLSRVQGLSPSGSPYELLALGALEDGAAIRSALLAARSPVRRETFEYYWSEANRLSRSNEAPPADAVALSVWAEQLFHRWNGVSGSGREIDESGAVRMWHANSSRVVALVTPPGWLLSTLAPASGDIRVRHASGGTASGISHAVRSLGDAQLNGKVEFISAGAMPPATGYRSRLSGLLLMFGLMLAGAYASYRGIRRELQAAELQADFVAAVSHEFRSPLTTLRSVAELLVNDRIADPSRRRHSYTLLERETGRLQRLVEDLLDFGRMESGRRHYRLESHDAFALVRSAVAEFREEAMAVGYAIELDLPSGEGTAQVDAEALSRAVRNLLENAVKYSPECRTVWVQGAVSERNITIAVRDQGIGIPPAEQRVVFQNFVRGAEAKRAGIKGTGIGLAMVRHIMEACGGQVHLDSTPGAGSVFTLRLPVFEGGKTQA